MSNQTIVIKKDMFKNNVVAMTVLLPNAEGVEVERTLKMYPNPGWLEANEVAAKALTTTTTPRFKLSVDKFPFKKDDYNGSGALWLRGEDYNSGTFQWLDKTYAVVRAIVEVGELSTNEETGEVITTMRKRDVFSIKPQVVEVVDTSSDIYG